MLKYAILAFLSLSLFPLLSSSLLAHNSGFAHPEPASEMVHLLMHLLILPLFGALAFLLSRWLIHRKQH